MKEFLLLLREDIERYASMSPEEMQLANIGDGLVRVSIGIEDWRDLLADFEQALACCV